MQLLRTQRFLPLFITQFMGAFNDNLFKNALVMLITYRMASDTQNAQTLVTLAAGLFILPFFIFSATAGQLADKFDRARLTRIIKLVEIGIMLAAAVGFYMQEVYFLLFALFCMGTHSTFFGPIKYALLPQHLQESELIEGNGFIESGTFLAILFGTILGGLLILHESGQALISAGIISVAVLGYIASRYIPPAPAPDPTLTISPHIWKETWRIIGYSRQDRRVFLSILGISWFWLIGATFLAQFPTYASAVLHGDETVVTLFLTLFSVGIGVGSMLCGKLLKGEISSKYVPLAAAGISLFMIDLYLASGAMQVIGEDLIGARDFLMQGGWRIALDLFLVALCGGIYIVPLYALMQHRSAVEHRARIIAANNVMNALFMVASAVATLVMLQAGIGVVEIFLSIAVLNGFAVVVMRRLVPRPAAA